jgi:cellulose synthase operon protein YhjQ
LRAILVKLEMLATDGPSGNATMTEGREDIGELYSRAHLEGTRYWDFSASRKQVRGQFRRRIRSQSAEEPLSPQAPAVPSFQAGPAGQTGQLSPSEEGPIPRWYALHSVLQPGRVSQDVVAAARNDEQRPPLLLVLSLAGGVGKTCLVATLGRALAALGEHVLLADTAVCGMLPFYFGSRESKPGVVRTFAPPLSSAASPAPAGPDTPVRVLNLPAEHYLGDRGGYDPLLAELLRDARSASRILVDVATASRDVTSRLLLLRPSVLVPVLPDMSSVASLRQLQLLLADAEGATVTVFYLLNQFDQSLPLHMDVRSLLQQELGDRLLPFVVRRSSAVCEALAEGMTVIDYAANSGAVEDYRHLAGWLRSHAAPAPQDPKTARWSER